MIGFSALHVVTLAALICGSAQEADAERQHPCVMSTSTVQVAGSGVDHLNTALVHSKEPTGSGMIQKSTEIVELTGGLNGRVLYHVTSVFDFVRGTLVNTGNQVFSGTIAGSAPVMIHDDEFRFDVNLVTGEESGKVYLLDHIAGPKVRCTLDVVGTGFNSDGNPTFDSTGQCTFRSAEAGD